MKLQRTFRLLVTVALLLSVGPLAAAPARSESPRVAVPARETGTAIGDKILAKWTCIRPGPTQVEMDFKLTGEGHVYRIHFVKGLEDPYAIRAAIHAVLSGMPYQHSKSPSGITNVHCSISGDRTKPKIAATLSPAPNDLSINDLSGVRKVEEYIHRTFISWRMLLRLNDLCEHLFNHPDSDAAISEVKKVFSFVRLDTRSAHDWVGVSRSGDLFITIKRHPSQKSAKMVRSKIGALLQAWRISSDRANFYALEDAWVEHAAIEALAASKADPLMLASASVLTNQYKMAKEQYKIAIREKNPKAAPMLSNMTQVSTDKFVKPATLDSRFKLARGASDWKTLLRWVPTDIELIISGRVDSSKNSQEALLSPFGPLLLPGSPDVAGSMEFQSKPYLLENNKLFEGVAAISCLHAARNFGLPKSDYSDSVDILVLPKAQKAMSSKAMNHVRRMCDERDVVEGFEVLSFDSFPWSFGVTELGTKHFLVQPCEGVLIAASDLGILRELLMRLRSQPEDRALVDSLPEWKYADISAPVWAVRHYDQSFVPFDYTGMSDIRQVIGSQQHAVEGKDAVVPTEIGLAYSTKGRRIIIRHLSNNPKTLIGLKKSYERIFSYSPLMPTPTKVSKPKELEVSSIKDNVLTIEGQISEFSLVPLQISMALGYYVAL